MQEKSTPQHDATRRPQSRFSAGVAFPLPIEMFDDPEPSRRLNDATPEEWTASARTIAPTTDSAPATGVDAILNERGNRYGKFTGHAEITQLLKLVVSTGLAKRNKVLAPDQQEALDMICHKIGRIINGDENYDDSWVDIAGYAKLVADRLQGVER